MFRFRFGAIGRFLQTDHLRLAIRPQSAHQICAITNQNTVQSPIKSAPTTELLRRARDAEIRDIWRCDRSFGTWGSRRNPVVRHRRCAIYPIRQDCLGSSRLLSTIHKSHSGRVGPTEIGIDILPHNLPIGSNLEESPVHPFVDQSVSIAKTPGATDE